MRGILRVIPSEASCKSHRKLVIRSIPNERLLDDLVDGHYLPIDDWETALDDGKTLPCLALRADEPGENSFNSYASILWVQAKLRKFDGWCHGPSQLWGTVVLLYGDDEFYDTLIETLAFRELQDSRGFDAYQGR